MKIGLHLFSLILTLVLATQFAVAEPGGRKRKGSRPATPGIDQRLERQKARIAKKLEHGKITPAEAEALSAKVDAVEASKQTAKEGGVTREERKALHTQLNETKAEIRKTGKPPKAPQAEGQPAESAAESSN